MIIYMKVREDFNQVYTKIVEDLIKEAENCDINYYVPGNPLVAEKTVELLMGKGFRIGNHIWHEFY